jgi:hypothetical protein
MTILPCPKYSNKFKYAECIIQKNVKGGDHFVDTGTAGRKIKGSFKMWLALTEIQMHGTNERLMP